jgi:hypothetical protein
MTADKPHKQFAALANLLGHDPADVDPLTNVPRHTRFWAKFGVGLVGPDYCHCFDKFSL